MRLEELNAVRSLKMRLTEAQEGLRRTETALKSMVPIRDGLPRTTPLTSRIERLTVQRLAYLETIDGLSERLKEAAVELATLICLEVPDELGQTLLLLRYVECLSWSQVAERMSYARRHCFRLHKKIITSLACTDRAD